MHTAAARLYCRLTQFLQDFRANSKSSKILHDIEVFQVEQLPNPGVIGEIIHGKANDRMTWKIDAEQSLMFHLRSNKPFLGNHRKDQVCMVTDTIGLFVICFGLILGSTYYWHHNPFIQHSRSTDYLDMSFNIT